MPAQQIPDCRRTPASATLGLHQQGPGNVGMRHFYPDFSQNSRELSLSGLFAMVSELFLICNLSY
jgi:hypothetical protein